MTVFEFSLTEFTAQSGKGLYEYFSEVIEQSTSICPEVLDDLANRLGELDEEHLVYGIEICSHFNTSQFISKLIPFLTHDSMSVSLSVQRALLRSEPNLITSEIWSNILAVKATLPTTLRESLDFTIEQMKKRKTSLRLETEERGHRRRNGDIEC